MENGKLWGFLAFGALHGARGRGESGAELLPRAQAAIAWLLEHGAQPGGNGRKGNEQAPDTKVCPIHHVAMRKRTKNGDTWWSHRAVDPDTGQEYWCRGKAE